MSTKDNDPCRDRALPNEPIFTLLARDPDAPELVRLWAENRGRDIVAGERPKSDLAVIDEAFTLANEMEVWRVLNNGKWRTP